MFKTALILLSSIVSVSLHAASQGKPTDVDQYYLSCGTERSFDGDTLEAAIEKFGISEKKDGVRYLRLGNSKESYPCVETAAGLNCSGYAYQLEEDQDLNDVTEDQKFMAVVKLDYSRFDGAYFQGDGFVPSGRRGDLRKYDVYCEVIR